jgi:hypothetical protein
MLNIQKLFSFTPEFSPVQDVGYPQKSVLTLSVFLTKETVKRFLHKPGAFPPG